MTRLKSITNTTPKSLVFEVYTQILGKRQVVNGIDTIVTVLRYLFDFTVII